MSSFIAWDIPTILVALLTLALGIALIDKFLSAKKQSSAPDKTKKTLKEKLMVVLYFSIFLKTHKLEDISVKPKIVEWSISLYPVILLVLVLRSFIIEPFQIPSNSMMPTLLTGDFILVNKFVYGVRLPVTNTKIMNTGKPKYGDILVFRYPNYEKSKEKKGLDYIKRVIGTPGDRVVYKNDQLWVNNQLVINEILPNYIGVESGIKMTGFKHQKTNLNDTTYNILLAPNTNSKFFDQCSNHIQDAIKTNPVLEFYPRTNHCSSHYQEVIPKGYYLVMGDNRSRSSDGRFWGYVPEDYILGKAFFIWMHLDQSFKFGRLGSI